MRLKRSVQVSILATCIALISALALPAMAGKPAPAPLPSDDSEPTAIEHCNHGNWAEFDTDFQHQGDCVSYVIAEKDDEPSGDEGEGTESGEVAQGNPEEGGNTSDSNGAVERHHGGAEGEATIVINNDFVHEYSLEIAPCTGDVSGSGHIGSTQESLSGSYEDGTLTMHSQYDRKDNYSWTFEAEIDLESGELSDVDPLNSSIGQTNMTAEWSSGEWNAAPARNHGQYVKASDSPQDAAHSCAGMPVKANKKY